MKVRIKRPAGSVAAKTAAAPAQSTKTTSRVRSYLKPGQGKYFDPSSPDTAEGRLSRYNPEDWYAPSKNEHDHGERLIVEFPHAVLDELTNYVNSGKFPLGRSVKQAVRVAVLEFLFVLRKLEPIPNSHMALIETMTFLNANSAITSQYEEQFTTGRANIYRLSAMGAVNEARKLVHDLIALAKKIPAKDLRAKYMQDLRREFRGLLASGKKTVRTNVRKNAKSKGRKKREHWEP